MSWMWRTIFATMLVMTVGIDLQSYDPPREVSDLALTVVRLLESRGLAYQQTRSLSNGLLTSMVFEAKGCSRPVQVVPLDFTFEKAPLLYLVDEPGDVRRFIYFERNSPIGDRIGILVEHVKQKILALLGRSRYFSSPTFLVVTEPPNCRAAEDVDWRLIWDREYRDGASRR
jgi:hypothetical protein